MIACCIETSKQQYNGMSAAWSEHQLEQSRDQYREWTKTDTDKSVCVHVKLCEFYIYSYIYVWSVKILPKLMTMTMHGHGTELRLRIKAAWKPNVGDFNLMLCKTTNHPNFVHWNMKCYARSHHCLDNTLNTVRIY